MTIATINYGVIVPVTITLASLAAGASAVSNAISNSAGNLDFLVEVTIAPSGTPTGTAQIALYADPGIDSNVYADTTLVTNLFRIGILDVTGKTASIVGSGYSVAAAFGGVMPPSWKLVVLNNSGVALAASGNSARVLPLNYNAT